MVFRLVPHLAEDSVSVDVQYTQNRYGNWTSLITNDPVINYPKRFDVSQVTDLTLIRFRVKDDDDNYKPVRTRSRLKDDDDEPPFDTDNKKPLRRAETDEEEDTTPRRSRSRISDTEADEERPTRGLSNKELVDPDEKPRRGRAVRDDDDDEPAEKPRGSIRDRIARGSRRPVDDEED